MLCLSHTITDCSTVNSKTCDWWENNLIFCAIIGKIYNFTISDEFIRCLLDKRVSVGNWKEQQRAEMSGSLISISS